MNENFISFDLDAAERDIDAAVARLKAVRNDLVEPVAREVLPKLGDEMLLMIRQSGPRSHRHRGAGKNNNQKWRSEFTHAIDTIKRGAIHRDKATGQLQVIVGPGRGDNSPSFYLKFFEYGSANMAPKPFLRPARRMIMDQRAVPMTVAAINKRLKGGG